MGVVADLRRIPLFEKVSEEELFALAEVAHVKTYAKGELICEKGGPGDALFVTQTGKVRVFTTDDEGREIALHIYGAGSFFGELALLDGLPRSASVAALEESSILILPRAEFLDQLRAHPRMILQILSAITGRLRMTTERAESIAFLNIYGRLALQLLNLADKHGKQTDQGIEIGLDLTPDDLASLAGVDPEGLQRVLQFYSDAGLVVVDWPRIVVRDLEGLRQRLVWHRRKRLV